MLPIFSRFLYILCTQYRYQLAINSEINCLQFRDFSILSYSNEVFALMRGERRTEQRKISYTHTYTYLLNSSKNIITKNCVYTYLHSCISLLDHVQRFDIKANPTLFHPSSLFENFRLHFSFRPRSHNPLSVTRTGHSAK